MIYSKFTAKTAVKPEDKKPKFTTTAPKKEVAAVKSEKLEKKSRAE